MRSNNTVLRPSQTQYFGGGYGTRRLSLTASSVQTRFQYLSETNSNPEGTQPHSSYWPAIKSGGLSTYGKLQGAGDVVAHLTSGKALTSTLAGDGTITQANLSLVVQLAATMAGAGDITQAQLQAIASLASTLSGSGDITQAQLGAIVQMASTLSGSGTISAATMRGILSMSASLTVADVSGIAVVGVVTKEEIAAQILTSILADYSDTGNVAEGIENASSAGNPWSALLDDNNDPGTFGERVQKLLTLAKYLGLKG